MMKVKVLCDTHVDGYLGPLWTEAVGTSAITLMVTLIAEGGQLS